ncbi:hypothetical protein DPEC_G00251450 [Dallia pectoralis]|uniref:Uncharacterized protein n=1 Tax=Dallia pectoralis TaxID=75939 RepID=A0ACC2FT54_DALPE|nr:hypothetical protein DPEC_G00251450 [Dallia pectoralis]
MWTLLLGLILGLLVPGHSHPVPASTELYITNLDTRLAADPPTRATTGSNDHAKASVISDLEAWLPTSDPEGSADEVDGSGDEARFVEGSTSPSPMSEFEKEDLISMNPLPRFSTSGPVPIGGSRRMASFNQTEMSGLGKARAAKTDTERPATELPFTTAGISATADGNESGSGMLETTDAMVTDPDFTIAEESVEIEDIINPNVRSALAKNQPSDTIPAAHDANQTPSAQKKPFAKGWWIIPVFVIGVVVTVSVCIIIVTSESWNRQPQTEKDEVAKAKTGDELENKGLLSNGKTKENCFNGQYTIIPLEEIPEKEPLD